MRKKAKKVKLEDLDGYIADCRYCKKQITRHQSFVAFYSKDYAHYQCMKEEDEKQQKDPRHNQN